MVNNPILRYLLIRIPYDPSWVYEELKLSNLQRVAKTVGFYL